MCGKWSCFPVQSLQGWRYTLCAVLSRQHIMATDGHTMGAFPWSVCRENGVGKVLVMDQTRVIHAFYHVSKCIQIRPEMRKCIPGTTQNVHCVADFQEEWVTLEPLTVKMGMASDLSELHACHCSASGYCMQSQTGCLATACTRIC